jgi:hypothetical protein
VPFVTGRYGASGPMIEILIGVSEPRRRAMLARGTTPNPELRLLFLIDTGADSTMVNEQHMRTLGIDARGSRDILTATSEAKPTACNTYDVAFKLATFGDDPLMLPAIEVIGRPLFNLSIDGMVGRDILNRVVLLLDGPRMQFRIDY